MPPEVRDAWQYATSHYVKLTKLQDAVGARIAELTGAEAAMVTSGAAGALTVGTAGILTGTDPEKIRRLPDTSGMRNEVLIQKSHRFAYDHAVRSTGVTMVELETPEDVARLAGDRTAMMLFFNDANDRGRIRMQSGCNSQSGMAFPRSSTVRPTCRRLRISRSISRWALIW